MEETTRQNLIMAFNNVLRTSALAGVVDAQRAALAFGTTLQETEEGVIHLGPLHDFLLQQGGGELAVVEVILFMKSREARFGVRMKVPPKLEALTPEQVDTIVLNFTSRGANSGTRAGQPVAPSASSPLPSSSSTAASSPSSQFEPDKKGDDDVNGRVKKLAIVAAILAVVAIGSYVWAEATRAPPPTALAISDPAALPCRNPVGSLDAVICRVPLAFFQKESREAIDARAQVTKAAVMARGYKRILLYTDENNRLQRVISW